VGVEFDGQDQPPCGDGNSLTSPTSGNLFDSNP
jgi:hypothetical protein